VNAHGTPPSVTTARFSDPRDALSASVCDPSSVALEERQIFWHRVRDARSPLGVKSASLFRAAPHRRGAVALLAVARRSRAEIQSSSPKRSALRRAAPASLATRCSARLLFAATARVAGRARRRHAIICE
jgi:hypothetical protein